MKTTLKRTLLKRILILIMAAALSAVLLGTAVSAAPIAIAGSGDTVLDSANSNLFFADGSPNDGITGIRMGSNAGRNNIGWWMAGEYATWDISVAVPGTYSIMLYGGRPFSADPREITVKAGDRVLTVIELGGLELGAWGSFVEIEGGNIELTAADTTLTLLNSSAFGDLLNLVEVTLTFVEAAAAPAPTPPAAPPAAPAGTPAPVTTAPAAPQTSDAITILILALAGSAVFGFALIKKAKA